MKNKEIIDSWSKIKPDDATHERILNNILDRVHSGETKKGKVYIMVIKPMKILVPIAACLIVALAISIPMLLYDKGGNPIPHLTTNDGDSSASVETPAVPSQSEEPNTPASDVAQAPIIVINELPMMPESVRLFPLEPADFVAMSRKEIVDFYGFDFFPKVIPSGMMEAEEGTFGVYRRNEGTGEVYNSVNLAWYVDENVSRELSVEIEAGRIPITDALLLADEYEKSVINGIELVILRSVDGYSSEEMFSAEFIHKNNGLRVYSRNLTQAEFVDILTSLLQIDDVGN